MKFIEPIILAAWLMGIVIIQFHPRTNTFMKKWDYLGLLPNFHLFSPKPFQGIYLIRYIVSYDNDIIKTIHNEELQYWGKTGIIDSNQKIIKCVNNLCNSSIYRPVLSNVNFALLLNFVKIDARKKAYFGKVQFFILIASDGEETLKLSSRIYDL